MNDLSLKTLLLIRENAWVHLKMLENERSPETHKKIKRIRSFLNDLEWIIKLKTQEYELS